MRSNDPMESMLRRLRYQATAERWERTLQNIFHAMDELQEQAPAAGRVQIRRMTLGTRALKLALAAAVILIVLGGATFWPFGHSGQDRWWLGSPAAWGQEILHSLDQTEAVVYRQRVGYVSDYGPPQMSRGYEIRFNAKGRYRRDRYDNGVDLANVQWVMADGNGLQMTEVSHEYRCYFERENEGYGFVEDIMGQMQSYVQLLDRADRILQTEVFEGRECVGFEVHTRHGDGPQGPFHRIWFDVQTRLPARIESHYVNASFDAGRTLVLIHDQFEYYTQVPVDLLTPQIPAGYVHAHPDDVRAARDRQVKGEMVYAEVPKGLKEKAVAALKEAVCGCYRQNDTTISFAKSAWREDSGPDSAPVTKWYVLRGALPSGPFEPNDRFAVTETTVDGANRTYRFRDHTGSSQPRHPMLRLLFLAGLIDRADRFDDAMEIDGVRCCHLEISAKKYGDNPDGMIDRIWLDAATSLPVRMEFEWPGRDGSGAGRQAWDRFQWNLSLPDDYFVPKIPAGFTPTDGKE